MRSVDDSFFGIHTFIHSHCVYFFIYITDVFRVFKIVCSKSGVKGKMISVSYTL